MVAKTRFSPTVNILILQTRLDLSYPVSLAIQRPNCTKGTQFALSIQFDFIIRDGNYELARDAIDRIIGLLLN